MGIWIWTEVGYFFQHSFDGVSRILLDRICPGRHFGMASLFIYCSSVLHSFDIPPPLDERGVPVKMEYRTTEGIIQYVRQRLHSQLVAYSGWLLGMSRATTMSSSRGACESSTLQRGEHNEPLRHPDMSFTISTVAGVCCVSPVAAARE